MSSTDNKPQYLTLYSSKELNKRIEKAFNILENLKILSNC